MKNVLSRLLAVLLVLAMAVSIVACSGGTTANDSSGTPADNSESTPAESTGGDEEEAEPYTITVSMPTGTGVQEGWDAVKAAYETIHPEATIVIDLKPMEGYSDWLNAVGSDYSESPVDVVTINLMSNRVPGEDTINWNEYMNEPNPYDPEGRAWKETFSYESQTRDGIDNSFDALNLFSVQVVWFYNADIFEEVGVQPPTTWDELIEVCEKIDAAGYQPISIAGDYNSFYQMEMAWLAQVYCDQTNRTSVEVWRAQPGDYCYNPDVDPYFELDITDPWNDVPSNFTNNPLRFWAAVQDGTLTPNNPGVIAVWENFTKVFDKYAGGEAMLGTSDAWPLFYQGKAAMGINLAGFAVTFSNTMARAAAGETIMSGDTEVQGVKPFKLGMFNMPSMTNPDGQWGADEIFQAPARTLEVPNGFLGAFNRDAQHNAQVVDFLMYYSSAEGMSVYLDAALAAEYAPTGSSLVYGVTYPEEIQAAFDSLSFIGNCQKVYNNSMTRGLGSSPESTRAWVELGQACVSGEITPEEFAAGQEEQYMRYFTECLPTDISLSDLEHPQNAPTGETAG